MNVSIRDSVDAGGIQFRASKGSVLIVVEYWDESARESSKKTLEGFGQGTCLDWASKAKSFVVLALSGSFEIKERLGIPVYIAEVFGDASRIQELLEAKARNINERNINERDL